MSKASTQTSNQNMASKDRKSRRFLSADKKFHVFLEAQHGDKPVAEILRREDLYSSDLVRIRQQVKEGALERLSNRPGKRQRTVPTEEYESIKQELE